MARAVFCFAFLISLMVSGANAANRVALVIGNSDYKLIPALENPQNDADLMASTLKDLGFEVILAKNANRRGMARAIRQFGRQLRKAGPQAVGLFYYAGHGIQAGGTNYLIPLGAPAADEADLEIEAVSASWVLGQMKSAGNALNMVIMDACRNNPFKGTFRSATRGLARMNAPSGSLIAYAAAPGQLAADGETANSPYTAALVTAMKEPGLPLEQVFKRVRVSVENATEKRQTPWEESSLRGDFYFNTNSALAPIADPEPATIGITAEMLFWQSIEDSTVRAMFVEYLKQYPKGTYAGLARIKLARLKEGAAATLEQNPKMPVAPAADLPAEAEKALGLLREDRRQVQTGLNRLAHKAGPPDGLFGKGTREAIRRYQQSQKAPATGYLTADQAKALMAKASETPVAVVPPRRERLVSKFTPPPKKQIANRYTGLARGITLDDITRRYARSVAEAVLFALRADDSKALLERSTGKLQSVYLEMLKKRPLKKILDKSGDRPRFHKFRCGLCNRRNGTCDILVNIQREADRAGRLTPVIFSISSNSRTLELKASDARLANNDRLNSFMAKKPVCEAN